MGFLVSLVIVYILGVEVGGDQKGLPCYNKELFHIKKEKNYLKYFFIHFIFILQYNQMPFSEIMGWIN